MLKRIYKLQILVFSRPNLEAVGVLHVTAERLGASLVFGFSCPNFEQPLWMFSLHFSDRLR